MNPKRLFSLLIFLLLLFLAACAQPQLPLPTSLPVAALPTATQTSLPPTTDFTALTGTPIPTIVSPTNEPTITPSPPPPLIGISSPDNEENIVLGSDIIVKGLGQWPANLSGWLALISSNGRLLNETKINPQDLGWETELTVPGQVSGAAFLEASIRDEAGNIQSSDRVPVNLVSNTESTDRFLTLYHPVPGEAAVGGFNLFFDGLVFRPTGSAITISVWIENCQTQIARQSFTLGRSNTAFYWQGFVIIPNETFGDACAIAHFGEPEDEAWREAIVPIQILSPDDEAAKGVQISTPAEGSHIMAGRELLLYGTALNVSEKPVSIAILMENGRIISQSTAPADHWGYWEFRVTIPPDVAGPAKIAISAGDQGSDNFAESEIIINVDPAPASEN